MADAWGGAFGDAFGDSFGATTTGGGGTGDDPWGGNFGDSWGDSWSTPSTTTPINTDSWEGWEGWEGWGLNDSTTEIPLKPRAFGGGGGFKPAEDRGYPKRIIVDGQVHTVLNRAAEAKLLQNRMPPPQADNEVVVPIRGAAPEAPKPIKVRKRNSSGREPEMYAKRHAQAGKALSIWDVE